MRILYGVANNNNDFDVTNICINILLYGKYIIIPHGDRKRTEMFGDPAPEKIKSIYIIFSNGTMVTCRQTYRIKINIFTEEVEYMFIGGNHKLKYEI